MVLSGSAQRRALLDNRRLVAVERVWAAVGKLAPFVMASASMARIKFDVAARYAPTDPNFRKIFDAIANPSLLENLKSETPAINELTDQIGKMEMERMVAAAEAKARL
jgi:hypothetical protein